LAEKEGPVGTAGREKVTEKNMGGSGKKRGAKGRKWKGAERDERPGFKNTDSSHLYSIF